MGDLDKLIVAKDFKKLPKVQKIAQSGHTDQSLGIKQLWGEQKRSLLTWSFLFYGLDWIRRISNIFVDVIDVPLCRLYSSKTG